MEKQVYNITTPPKFVYAKKGIQDDNSRQVFKEGERNPLFTIIRMEYPSAGWAWVSGEQKWKEIPKDPKGGIFLYYKELKYPRKGFVYPEAVHAVNFAKRQVASWLRFFSKKELWLSYLGVLVLPWSMKRKVISRFLRTLFECVDPILAPHYLGEIYYMAPAKELARYFVLFLKELGIEHTGCEKIISMMIEYDSAYCWRIQDIFTEVRKDALIRTPQKEIDRLLGIFMEREKMSEKVRSHFRSLVMLLKLALRNGTIKRAFIRATEQIDLTKIALTEADKYHCMFYDGYDFCGKNAEQKKQFLTDLHGEVPRGQYQLNVH